MLNTCYLCNINVWNDTSIITWYQLPPHLQFLYNSWPYHKSSVSPFLPPCLSPDSRTAFRSITLLAISKRIQAHRRSICCSLSLSLGLVVGDSQMSGACETNDDSPVAAGGSGEIMLFGVRLLVDSMRKSVSLNNLSQYVHPQDLNSTGNCNGGGAGAANKVDAAAAATAGYASMDDAAHNSSSSGRERKRGTVRICRRFVGAFNSTIISMNWRIFRFCYNLPLLL